MTTSPIRTDAQGLYVKTGGYVFRPGAIRSYSHALRMDDAGLVAGDRVKARHKGGTPLAKLTLMDGTMTYWSEEATAAKDAAEILSEAVWKPDGTRDLSHLTDNTNSGVIARQIKALNGESLVNHLRQT